MEKGQFDARRQSPRKQDKANNQNNADDKGSPSRLMSGSGMVGVMSGSDCVRLGLWKPPPPQYNMVGPFGGPCFNESTKTWKTSFEVEVDGSIDVDDEGRYDQVRHLAHDRQQIHAAMDCVGRVAKRVTGKLFITVIRKSSSTGDISIVEEVQGATMSGFWLDKTKFMTCAHFLEIIRGTDADETETFLKVPNPERPRAFVSNKKRAAELNADSPDSWPVYLRRLSKSSDIAIFELTQAQAKGGNHPPYSVQLNELSSSFALPTGGNALGMSFKETDLAHMPLFAAYYPGDNMSVKDSDVSPIRKEFAKQAHIEHTWGLWCAESQNFNPGAGQGPDDYATTFTPHSRSVAFGQVETDHRGVPQHGKQGDNCHVQTRECSIVGSFGCSGGMVCHLYREANRWRSVVVGLYHGESLNDRRFNEFVAFTPDFVEAIRTGAF